MFKLKPLDQTSESITTYLRQPNYNLTIGKVSGIRKLFYDKTALVRRNRSIIINPECFEQPILQVMNNNLLNEIY